MHPYVPFTVCLLLVAFCYCQVSTPLRRVRVVKSTKGTSSEAARSLVLYAYFEKDAIQVRNFEFFIRKGIGIGDMGATSILGNAHVAMTVNGELCSPCASILPHLSRAESRTDAIQSAWAGDQLTLLYRKKNVGMDIAAHNVCPIGLHLLSCTLHTLYL